MLYAQAPLDRRDYISLDLGGTYSWLTNAPGFYFPYVYEYDARQPGEAQKMRFLELGEGFGYRTGASLDLRLLDDAALRFSLRYGLQTTSRSEQANYDCAGNLGPYGQVVLESGYFARWRYIGADAFLRKSVAGDLIYALIGAGYSYLLGDKFDGDQRIVSSQSGCEYLWLPSGDKTGKSSVSVRDQTSANYYAASQYLAKLGAGAFFPVSENLVVSPEIILNVPLNRMMTSSAAAVYDRESAATPKLWSMDVMISLRYALGEEKKKYPSAPEPRAILPKPRPPAEARIGYQLTGKVRNANNQPIAADIVVTRLDSGTQVTFSTVTNLVGYYNVTVPVPGAYSVTASARDFLFGSALFVVSPDGSITSPERDIALSPEDGKIRLLVFFGIDKAELAPTSFPELDRAVKLMEEMPSMEAEIAGHTDSTGTPEHNLDLSRARADVVRTYLIAKGIRTDRLTATGYGAAQPIATNATEPGRAENRRVEFKVRKR